MCGRFHLATPPEDVARIFGLDHVPHVTPRYNIAPTQVAGVIRAGSGAREWAPMQWGLVPSWARDASGASKMINARSETAADKPAFRAAFRRRRCLVPATGFYEWRKLDDGSKQPLSITMADREPFAMAGLWEAWASPDGALETFTILTCPANEALERVHDRMPVILPREQWGTWLDPRRGDADEDRDALRQLLLPYPADEIESTPVSRRVNSPANDDPSLVDPVETPPTSLFEEWS